MSLWAEDDLEKELAAVGLRIKTMEADGNCFFRSVCDQLEVGAGRFDGHWGWRSLRCFWEQLGVAPQVGAGAGEC